MPRRQDIVRRLSFAGLGAAAYLAAFWGAGFLIFLAPGLLARALDGLSGWRKCGCGILWGMVVSGVFYWWAFRRDWPLWCCLLLLKGGPWLLFHVPVGLWQRRWPLTDWSRALGYGLGVGLVAQAQLLEPVGFDWETPAGALVEWPWCLSLLPWIGLPGMAALLGTVSCLLVGPRSGLGKGGILLILWVAASVALFPAPNNEAVWPRVALIQTGWEERAKWAPENRAASYQRLADLSRQAREQGANLLVWPEMAWPVSNLRRHLSEARKASALAKSLDVDLVVSSLEKPSSTHWYNSASLVTSTGRFAAEHRKRRLIPVQEYLPLPHSWESFLRRKGWVRSSCHYQPGEKDILFESNGRRFGVLICWESVVPRTAARLADQVDFFVIQANDARLRSSFAREAHFRSAILRAAQFRKPVYQAANDGVSGFIDFRGVVLSRTLPGQQQPQVLLLP